MNRKKEILTRIDVDRITKRIVEISRIMNIIGKTAQVYANADGGAVFVRDNPSPVALLNFTIVENDPKAIRERLENAIYERFGSIE